MILHRDIGFFKDTIRAASEHLKIKQEFVEKDYWITLVLNHLSLSEFANETVFKGGTSLSKGYNLISRFSEDVDIAIINDNHKSGNQIKTLIRTVEKDITKELNELQMDGVTSKGSRFRKSVFEYESIDSKNKSNKLIVEINSFANPFPFIPLTIKSMVYDFLFETGNEKYITQYNLQPFKINVLKKEQTLLEKTVSLIRFSYEENEVESISKKIRHFYDLYFLMQDKACAVFVNSNEFKTQFSEILDHDKKLFDEPKGWQTKSLADSPLLTNFENMWEQLKNLYKTELSALAYLPIPDEKKIADCFMGLMNNIR
jgi:predicted nucleotidyltransferase component of viral defense system